MNLEYYNSVSNKQLQTGGYYIEKIEFFLKNLRSFKKEKLKIDILDLACNEGTLSVKYKEFGNVYGVDINKYAVDESIRKGIDARLGDVLEISKVFDGRKFDVVIAGDIIEHIFDTDFFLENIKLSLKEDGMLLLSTPNIVSLGRRLMAVFGVNPYCEYSAEANGINVGHIRYYSIKNIKDQFIKKGLIIKSLEADTVNLPVNILNNYMSKYLPGLGREILVAAIKK